INGKSLLLVLNTCELTPLDCQTLINHLVGQCPGVRILATSREKLFTNKGCQHPLLGLPVPSHPLAADPDRLFSFESIQMFKRYAEEDSLRKLGADPQTLSELILICELVKGVPLGIELAASAFKGGDSTEQILAGLRSGTSMPFSQENRVR